MSWTSVIAARWRGLFKHAQLARELDDEVRFHLEMQIEDNIKTGMSREDARHAALLSFGGVAPMKETYRDRSAFVIVETLAQDIRYALRTLRKSPAFAITAVATLGLAIGANTAMFSVVNAVVLRPLPYRSPERLAMLWTGIPGQGQGRAAYLTADEWRRRSKTFVDMAILDPASATLMDRDAAERITVARVSPNFFPVLGVTPAQGRNFSEDDAEQRRPVALISHAFWQTHFGRSPGAVGASITLDGHLSQIIGVLPDSFDIPALSADVWEPHTLFQDWDARRTARGAGAWFVIGRLQPNTTFERAQAEMNAVTETLDAEWPAADRIRGTSVVPLSLYVVGARSRLTLWMLTGAVFCVLLIAAANVASLSLARGVGRMREMAMRAALGASPLRIVRQLLVESVTLGTISGMLGTLLALAGVRLIRAFGPRDLARLSETSLDLRVYGWTLAISLLAGALVGLAPAIMMFRRHPRPFEREAANNMSSGLGARKIRRVLVVAEFALAIVLMAGAGLLVRSWWLIERVDPGFRPDRVLSIQLATPAAMAPAQRANFYAGVLDQVKTLAGVESAGIVGDLFIGNDAERTVTVDGNVGITSERLRLRLDEVSERFFPTLGTRLVSGRFFSAADGPDAPHVAIVNDAMARRIWRGRDPVGTRFKFGPPDSDRPWFLVVGVVGNMRRQGLETEPVPQVFEPLAQNPSRLETLLVRTSADDPLTMVASVRAAVRRVDTQTLLYGVTTIEDRLGRYLAQRRFQTALLIALSGVALLMAAVGIYGLIHYAVAARTQEIGIRMAVGASRGDIFRMIAREGLQLSLAGLMFGLMGAVALGRVGSSLLFGVTPTDPLTFTVVALLLIAIAAVACYFPARRAMKIEPIRALRQS